ncbi:PHP domain-containing protein [Haploplasma modicum]|uniref:PHP domain-containing protein n=1 Tax=Haploplasma modicum TaxID=2150 RepID=UPI00214B9145|nr:PHP domain-containing protein [Haploplasma modicum]MCR1809417.1 PHP domain-containing protein [Haploplasma modicum]
MDKHDYNYHGHTFLCGHATGTPIEYVKEAIKKNYKVLGISEHAPMPNLRSKNSRLEIKNYDLYFELLKEASDYALENDLTFYKAFEIEYFSHLDLYEKYLTDVDYLILGQHYIIRDGKNKSTFGLDDIEDVRIYSKTVVEALKTGYFNLLAHPDLCFFNIKNPTDEMYELLRPIIKTAKELDIPLEVNANGIRRSLVEDNNKDINKVKYPKIKFFEMVKEENAKVIISSDCHSVDALDDFAISEANKFVKELGLDLVTRLKTNYYPAK